MTHCLMRLCNFSLLAQRKVAQKKGHSLRRRERLWARRNLNVQRSIGTLCPLLFWQILQAPVVSGF